MNKLYDLMPTDPLPALHLKGTVNRRFLISYPVQPEALSSLLPPGAEMLLHSGNAWVSACFVHISDLRPSFAPTWLGIGFNYLIHRTLARVPYPDGKLRPAVLVLEANINRLLFGLAARRFTGVRFQIREISLVELPESWVVKMVRANEVLYEAEISKDSIGTDIGNTSKFANATEADRFLLGVSFGTQWEPESHQIRLLAETHEPWQTLVGQCKTSHHAFLQSVGVQRTVADHVITMENIPHYFGLRGHVAPCPDAR